MYRKFPLKLKACVEDTRVVTQFLPAVLNNGAGLNTRHGKRFHFQARAAGPDQVAFVNAVVPQGYFRAIRLDGPPFHIHNRSVLAKRNVDGGRFLFSFFIEDFQPDIVVENPAYVLPAHDLVPHVNIPEERFDAGVLLHHRRLHVALGIRHRKPGGINRGFSKASERTR